MTLHALAFDAYGTLFDVHSVIATCNELFPGKGPALSQLWRAKQLEYTWLRSLMGAHADFWQVTGESLDYAMTSLEIEDPTLREGLRLLASVPDFPFKPKYRKFLGVRLAHVDVGNLRQIGADRRQLDVLVAADQVGQGRDPDRQLVVAFG